MTIRTTGLSEKEKIALEDFTETLNNECQKFLKKNEGEIGEVECSNLALNAMLRIISLVAIASSESVEGAIQETDDYNEAIKYLICTKWDFVKKVMSKNEDE
jgi:hypothetical protein